MAHKVTVPQKKIMSRSFLNCGTLIVIMYRRPILCTFHITVDFLIVTYKGLYGLGGGGGAIT
jgi:hypothetical protein